VRVDANALLSVLGKINKQMEILKNKNNENNQAIILNRQTIRKSSVQALIPEDFKNEFNRLRERVDYLEKHRGDSDVIERLEGRLQYLEEKDAKRDAAMKDLESMITAVDSASKERDDALEKQLKELQLDYNSLQVRVITLEGTVNCKVDELRAEIEKNQSSMNQSIAELKDMMNEKLNDFHIQIDNFSVRFGEIETILHELQQSNKMLDKLVQGMDKSIHSLMESKAITDQKFSRMEAENDGLRRLLKSLEDHIGLIQADIDLKIMVHLKELDDTKADRYELSSKLPIKDLSSSRLPTPEYN
jgi:predicted  nucleic acid-binding Zn-ribbon protein